jgi:antitoxin (DNA-binding transcriptional repressor) of toxin-antitoxin stability system
MTMKTLSSREVQKNFGSVADLVSSGENIRVTKYGRPAFFIIPETSDTEEILRRMAGKRLSKMLRNSTPTAAASVLSQVDVNTLIDECFA